MARWTRSLMDSEAALDTPDEGPCHGFNGRPTHWREIRALARAGPRAYVPANNSVAFPTALSYLVCGVHGRVGRTPGPGSIKNGGTESSPRIQSRLHASLEVKAMKTRNAWFALVVLLAVHGSARSDFIATATLTAEIRGRKIGDTFLDRPSTFPPFFRGFPGWLSLVFSLI